MSASAIGQAGHRLFEANLGLVSHRGDPPSQVGSSAASLALGGLVAAARLARDSGEALGPGEIALAGAAANAKPLRPVVEAPLEVQNLGITQFGVAA